MRPLPDLEALRKRNEKRFAELRVKMGDNHLLKGKPYKPLYPPDQKKV